jgi:hypothetical protein
VRRWSFVDRNSIDPVDFRAMNQKYLNLPRIVLRNPPARICPDAACVEDDATPSEAARLALGTYKATINVQDQVIPLIGPKRDQKVIATAAQFGQDCSLGPEPDVHRVRARFRRL